ncbi:hypothetical protein, partial [uncultured Brevundimonas sp.]|uniref:hypothetical protein n=1 Tax=uncultured Brevundimonas sp. TaxID=213418 RepID=UPI0032B2AB66
EGKFSHFQIDPHTPYHERILISPEQTSGRSKLNQDGKSLSFPLRRGGVRDGAMPHPSARPPPQ